MGSNKRERPFIEVLANHSLGAKQSITVVRIKDQQFVLGVTPDQVQLITQLDSDGTEGDVLDDPKIADSLGKMFGNTPTQAPQASFGALLKSSTGAGAIVARNAYQQAKAEPVQSTQVGVRDQIKQRLQGVRNV